MVKIINPMQGSDPLAQVLSNLGQQMWGDRSGGMLKAEQLYAAQRENAETENLMNLIATGGGAHALGASPMAQAMMVGSGYDPSKFADMGLMGAATGYGARDSRTRDWQIASGNPASDTFEAFDATLAETARNNDLQSTDRRRGDDLTNARLWGQFQNEPVAAVGPGGSIFGTNASVVNNPDMRPPVSETDARGAAFQSLFPTLDPLQQRTAMDAAPSNSQVQGAIAAREFGNMGALPAPEQTYLGADPAGRTSTPKNYILPDGTVRITYDGVTAADTGERLAGGYIGTVQGGAADVLPNTVRTGAINALSAAERFNYLADRAKEIATTDRTAFGALGRAQGLTYSAVNFLNTIGQVVGGTDFVTGVQKVEQGIINNPNLDPELKQHLLGEFNPNVPKIQSVAAMLAYVGAETIANQSGRDISNQDIQTIKTIIGDPLSLLATPEDFLARLSEAQAYVEQSTAISRRLLEGGPDAIGGAPAPTAPPPNRVAPGADAAFAPQAPVAGQEQIGQPIEVINPAGQREILREHRPGVWLRQLPDGRWEPVQ
jgi:hypothetical protein